MSDIIKHYRTGEYSYQTAFHLLTIHVDQYQAQRMLAEVQP